MPLNWLTALKVIPWSTVFSQAPAALDAANKLLSSSKRKKAELETTGEVETLKNRIAELEEHNEADAAVIKQLAEEAANLAAVTEVMATRVRIAVLLAGAGIVVATAALVVALFFH